MVGTEDYIPPEVLQEDLSGPPADLWSLGVIIYMMLFGQSPFKRPTQDQTFLNIVAGNYRFPDLAETEEYVHAKDLI